MPQRTMRPSRPQALRNRLGTGSDAFEATGPARSVSRETGPVAARTGPRSGLADLLDRVRQEGVPLAPVGAGSAGRSGGAAPAEQGGRSRTRTSKGP